MILLMKIYIPTLLFLLPLQILPNQTDWIVDHYIGIPDANKKVIFFDGFSDTKTQWKKSDFQKTITEVKENECTLTANKESQIIWQDLVMDKDGYEIEVRFKSKKDKIEEPLTLILAGSKNEFIAFEIMPEGSYAANIIKGYVKIPLLNEVSTVHINREDFNKVTIRSINKLLYFFINEHLIATCPLPLLKGYRFGVMATPKNPIIIDYLIMSDLIKPRQNTYTIKKPPSITPNKEQKSRYKM